MSTVPGVVVTYQPDNDIGARLAAIAREADPLILIDNSANPPVADRLRELAGSLGAHFIASEGNLGLAAALNRAFVLLAERGCIRAITFDQDSTPQPGFAAALAALAESNPRTAVVGANWIDEGRPNFPSRHLRRHPCCSVGFQRDAATTDLGGVTCVITSGALFDLPTWRRLAGFDETLFLDLVDTDYCLRARQAGYDIQVAAGAHLRHRRGNKQPVRRFGRTWWPAFMPPLRLRYLFRNRMRLLRRHALQVPHWAAFELFYATKVLAEILFLEEQKVAKVAACARGCFDGLRGRTGRIDLEA